MFLVDKYKDWYFHKQIYSSFIKPVEFSLEYKGETLHDISNYLESFIYTRVKKSIYWPMQNLLILGPHGSGKKTFVNRLLADIYPFSDLTLFKEKYNIKGYGNLTVDIELEQSKYHVIIEPISTGLDKYIVQKVITTFASKDINLINKYIPYKIIFIKNIDSLNYYAQTSLRCTMEKYSKTCRFILCGTNVSKIFEPICSRALKIVLSRPTLNEVVEYFNHISIMEDRFTDFTLQDYTKIYKESKGNITEMLWMLELMYNNIDIQLSWKKSLDAILTSCFQGAKTGASYLTDIQYCKKIRDALYHIFITNITSEQILHHILEFVINIDYDLPLSVKIISTIADYDYRLQKGKRHIIHLDSLILQIILLIYQHHEEHKCH
ncbi:putative replication factor C small subunit [Namao virus]|nr:putative replication factor C small subunit [Namao virus]